MASRFAGQINWENIVPYLRKTPRNFSTFFAFLPDAISGVVRPRRAASFGSLLGPPGADGTDSYVLGEINVSSVFPIPDEASAEIARRVADRLRSKLRMVERKPAMVGK
jgi:hypothetical protein